MRPALAKASHYCKDCGYMTFGGLAGICGTCTESETLVVMEYCYDCEAAPSVMYGLCTECDFADYMKNNEQGDYCETCGQFAAAKGTRECKECSEDYVWSNASYDKYDYWDTASYTVRVPVVIPSIEEEVESIPAGVR